MEEPEQTVAAVNEYPAAVLKAGLVAGGVRLAEGWCGAGWDAMLRTVMWSYSSEQINVEQLAKWCYRLQPVKYPTGNPSKEHHMAKRKLKQKPDWAKIFSNAGKLGADIEREFNKGYSKNSNTPKPPRQKPRTPPSP